MFEQLQWPGRRRWGASMVLSCALHMAALLVLGHHPAAVFVSPSDVDLGVPHSSGSLSITYLAPVGPELAKPAAELHLPPRHAVSQTPRAQTAEVRREDRPSATADNAPEQTARGGSPFGRVPGSPLGTDEVIPAFPVVYPDPPVSRADLPSGVQGDVIVEVTIDAGGNVVQTRLLQGIGYGVEQKVLQVLQRWHFHPAMRDGVTIASQHIVHFHYPA